MKRAVFPGSFDPLTNGHLDIILRAVDLFDELTILVAVSSQKNNLFSADERVGLIKSSLPENKKIKIESWSGLIVDYMAKQDIKIILRSVRGSSDFEYEQNMAKMNQHLSEQIETVFLLASDEFNFVSSSLVKEVAALNGDIAKLVPDEVGKALKLKLSK